LQTLEKWVRPNPTLSPLLLGAYTTDFGRGYAGCSMDWDLSDAMVMVNGILTGQERLLRWSTAC
jgi:hypothetical protein